jgi:hypothetical protein
MRSCSGPQADRIRKDLNKIFNNCGLKITAQTNLRSVSYLDVTLDLNTGLHMPYRKPNNDPVYINTLSNHPPTIIKHLPKSIGKRISEISSDQETFKKAAPVYNQALRVAGYNHEIKYVDKPSPIRPGNKKNRRRKVMWYNPPYSKSVKTNIGEKFLCLIDKHFPRGSRLHKIFNRYTLKVSYSCMKNMKEIIKSHNSQTMRKSSTSVNDSQNDSTCNCRKKDACPLRGDCLASDIVYKATVEADAKNVSCIGLCSGPFKRRFYNHTKSFKNTQYEKETELSKHIWKLKKSKTVFSTKWEILKKSNTNKRKSGMCNLCIEEKYQIITSKTDNLLNKRSELVSKCRHGNNKQGRSNAACSVKKKP